MSQWTIRFATPEDAATLAELGEQTFRDAFAADNRPEDLEDYIGKTYGSSHQRGELTDPNQLALLVEHNGAAVAFAQLRLEPEQVEISRFYVERTHHGRGIAHELMQRVIDAALERGAKKLWLGVWERNPRAIRFYEKCGFVDVGSHPFLIGTDLQTDRLMSMSLMDRP